MAKNSKENEVKENEAKDGFPHENELGYQPTRGYKPKSGIDRKNPPGKKKENATATTDTGQTGDYTENK